MNLEKLLGLDKTIPREPEILTDRRLTKVSNKVLRAGVNAIQNLNFTPAQLQESHNKQKAFTVAWLAMYTAVCSLSHRPSWDQLPNPKDAYEEVLKLHN